MKQFMLNRYQLIISGSGTDYTANNVTHPRKKPSSPTEATYNYFLRDNVRDHRAGTSDLPFLNHTQIRLRVLYIVMRRILLF